MKEVKAAIAVFVLAIFAFGYFGHQDPNKSLLANGAENLGNAVHTATSSTPAAATQPDLPAGVYGLGYRDQIADASRHNEMNFDRYYKGRRFDAVMPFNKTEAEILADGYRVNFGRIMAGAECKRITNSATVREMSGWSKGTLARVTGTIETTSLGDLVLSNCRITRA